MRSSPALQGRASSRSRRSHSDSGSSPTSSGTCRGCTTQRSSIRARCSTSSTCATSSPASLLWWPVFQDAPQRLGSGGKAVYLAAAFVFASPFGLIVSLLGRPIYPFYEHAPRLWGIDALQDQRIAGVAMTVEEAVLFFCLLAVYVTRFFHEEETRDLLSTAGR